jgi:membrane protein
MTLRMRAAAAWELARDTFLEWNADNATQMGAALAFYTFFSLAPLLIIAIAVAGLAFGRDAAQGRIVEQVQSLVGLRSARAIEALLLRAQSHGTGGLAGAVGFATLLVGASGVVSALQNAFDAIWKSPARGGLRRWLLKYVLCYAMVFGLGFVSLVSLALNAGLAAVGKYLTGLLPLPEGLLRGVDLVVSYAGVTSLFALMFRWLPQARPPWWAVWPGALCTALLFVAGKYLLGLYLGRFAVGSMYGAAGSLAIVMLWVYYSAQILYMGVEFTKVYARRRRA